MTNWCKSCKYYGESSLSYPCAICERAYDEPPTKHENIDCVEVVRCKDCVCSRELDGIEKLIYTEKTLMCGFFDSAVAEDGFCSEGERRGD